MKTKTAKRLTLNRETVSNLSAASMNTVKGGTYTGITCGYCDPSTLRASCIIKMCYYEQSCDCTM